MSPLNLRHPPPPPFVPYHLLPRPLHIHGDQARATYSHLTPPPLPSSLLPSPPLPSQNRSFYEDLPDLLSTVPPNLLGLTEEQAEQLREEERKKQRERNATDHQEADTVADGGGIGEGGEGGAGTGDGEDVLVEELTGLSVGGEGDEEGAEGAGGGDGGSDDEVGAYVGIRMVPSYVFA